MPLAIREQAHGDIDNGTNSYTRFDGLAQLREAIARKLFQHNSIQADPETEIVVAPGRPEPSTVRAWHCLNPGDEVILFEPYYGYHRNTLLAVEAVPRFVALHPPDWSFTRADLCDGHGQCCLRAGPLPCLIS